MLVSYRGSRSWAFRNREAVGVAGGRVAYFVINMVSMVIPLACLSFSRYVLGLSDPVADNVAANVIGLGLGTLARFWAIRRYIFLSPDAHVAHTERRQRRDLATQSPADPPSLPARLSPTQPSPAHAVPVGVVRDAMHVLSASEPASGHVLPGRCPGST